MSELTQEAIAAVDPEGTIGDVLAQPHQIADALWRIESAGIPRRELRGGLLVAGMGGSAIGAELAAAALDGRATAPVRAVRDYALEPWAGDDTLVLCASYSGQTEETLACFEEAIQKGITTVALTTGGRLAERAREEGVPVIGVPAGMQPRSAVVYMTVAALECAALCGAAPSLRPEIDAAQSLLARLVDEWGPAASDQSRAKALAHELHGAVPIIVGAGPTIALAKRWKNQLNENSKLPSWTAELPEADHNEVVGWERASDFARLHAVFLDDSAIDERTRRRIEPTARVAEASTRLEVEGDTLLERVLAMTLLGDLVSIYLAALDGLDPAEIDAIDTLKEQLRVDR